MTAFEMAAALDMQEQHVRNYCNNHGIKYKKTRNYERKVPEASPPKEIIRMKVEPPPTYIRPPAKYSNGSPMGIAKEGF